ncbi:MAG: methylmalonyl Co-A mutase-associated GTPase MeaB [Gemmatimonadaceae bacterium]|nr:methylmalonyl Co-A mutase-associated GTPase MeaB [Gemmatimonadaceae bacterium]
MNDIETLLAGAREGRIAHLARLLSIVENEEPGAADIVRATFGETGRAMIVGFTGPPGTGKSTLVSGVTAAYRHNAARVAVVAVDPSSPYTGGAILGDRIRMRERYLDTGVFIRSMANRGTSGGLARATRRVVGVLDGLGFDVVLVETVGVGQQEIDVSHVVDTVCLLTIPGAGDDIQAIKAGIMEIADVLVVNKADRPGADETVRDLTQTLTLGSPRLDWRPPVVKTSALAGTGIDELIAAIGSHRTWARASGEARRRKAEAMRHDIAALLHDRVLRDLATRIGPHELEAVALRVVDKTLDPYGAVDVLLNG